MRDRTEFCLALSAIKLELEYVRYSSELWRKIEGLKEEVNKEGSTKECLSSTPKPLEENSP